MPPNLKTFRALLLYGLLLALQAGSGLAESVERLQYQVSYRGAFSLGKDVPIADLVLQTRLPGGVAELGEARLEVSSSAYPLVEALYPIRYRFRSWNAPRDGGLIGFEDFEQTNRRRHRLYLRD
jgi:hypothetical protein